MLLGTKDDTKNDGQNGQNENDDTEADPAFASCGPRVLHGLFRLL